jgi:hypothetical protein
MRHRKYNNHCYQSDHEHQTLSVFARAFRNFLCNSFVNLIDFGIYTSHPGCSYLFSCYCSTLEFSRCQITFGREMSGKSEAEKALQRKYALLRKKQAEVRPCGPFLKQRPLAFCSLSQHFPLQRRATDSFLVLLPRLVSLSCRLLRTKPALSPARKTKQR